MGPVPIYQVDAFTDRAFAGNPAAVCLLREAAEPAWMQALAAEMNLAETAFLLPLAGGGFNLRWFTPTMEVDLCGHATLASAHVLWQTSMLPAGQTARFQTRSGELTAVRQGDWIEMDFPARPTEPAAPPAQLLDALGLQPRFTGFAVEDYVVEVESERAVRELSPELGLLAQLGARGAVVTARAEAPGIDFVSRFFAPGAGIPEDPVTGSTHCALGPFWAERLGKTELTGYQASARGGTVRVRLAGDRVKLLGQAVTVFEGVLSGTT